MLEQFYSKNMHFNAIFIFSTVFCDYKWLEIYNLIM